jgi:predicted 3-demethylubiquinone-9 3-methyltransferase (glyoxalase superfamily)
MPRSAATFLMFDGTAEDAMTLYASLFAGSEVLGVDRHGPGAPGPEGSLQRATVRVAGHELVCFNTPVKHDFGFTPAVSIFVECEDEAELESAWARLFEGGVALMELGDHGFSRRFGWVQDRFGVSWQLNLA